MAVPDAPRAKKKVIRPMSCKEMCCRSTRKIVMLYTRSRQDDTDILQNS